MIFFEFKHSLPRTTLRGGEMKIGINGFGRVGQALLQQMPPSDDLQIAAINEIGLSLSDAVEFLGDAASVTDSGDLTYAGRTSRWLALADHRQIGWEQYGVQVVVEASRLFLRSEMKEQSAGGQVTILMTGDLRDEPLPTSPSSSESTTPTTAPTCPSSAPAAATAPSPSFPSSTQSTSDSP